MSARVVTKHLSSALSAAVAISVGAGMTLWSAFAFASDEPPQPPVREAAPAAGHAASAAHGAAHGAEHGSHAIDLGTRLFGDSAEHIVGLVPTLINFVVLLVLIYYLVFRKLVQQNAARHDEIRQRLADATRAEAEAKAVRDEFRSKLDAFDREREELMEKTRAKAEAVSRRILEDARAEAEKIRVAAVSAAEREAEARRVEIENEIVDQAITKAEAILVSQFSETDQQRIVDDYVERVANTSLAGGRAS